MKSKLKKPSPFGRGGTARRGVRGSLENKLMNNFLRTVDMNNIGVGCFSVQKQAHPTPRIAAPLSLTSALRSLLLRGGGPLVQRSVVWCPG